MCLRGSIERALHARRRKGLPPEGSVPLRHAQGPMVTLRAYGSAGHTLDRPDVGCLIWRALMAAAPVGRFHKGSRYIILGCWNNVSVHDPELRGLIAFRAGPSSSRGYSAARGGSRRGVHVRALCACAGTVCVFGHRVRGRALCAAGTVCGGGHCVRRRARCA